MIFDYLKIYNFGTFKGENTVNFSSHEKKPINLIGGLNGAGKTTILNSIRILLYGQKAFNQFSDAKYKKKIQSLFHRPKNEDLSITTASLSLKFRYIENKEEKSILIERVWNHDSKNFDESFKIYNPKDPKEVYEGDIAQIFINQLIPPGIANFFIFDGEKLKDLVIDDNNKVFMQSVRILLGLDLIERIEKNISLFSNRELNKAGDETARKKLQDLNNQINKLKEEYAKLENKKLDLEEKRHSLKDHALLKESELSSLGGSFYENKKTIEYSIEKNNNEIKIDENKYREELGGLGVFSLCQNSIKNISKDINEHSQNSTYQANEFFLQNESQILKNITNENLDKKNAQRAIDNIKLYLKKIGGKKTDYLSDYLSNKQFTQLKNHVFEHIPNSYLKIEGLKVSLKKLYKDFDKLKIKLDYAPDEFFLKQLLDEINDANKEVQEVQSEIRVTSHKMIFINQELIDLLKKVEKIEKQIFDYSSDKKGLQNSENLKVFFKEYKIGALEDQAEILEKNFLETFQMLTRKDSIIKNIKIDPSTFNVSLLDSSQRNISKDELSEGEKQIYAISVMKSLAMTSGKNIPVIVDTPLARLDSKHRDKLVKNYFPTASHQVILLSTDTEIDKEYYRIIKDKTINNYHIDFDDVTGASTLKNGYFWS